MQIRMGRSFTSGSIKIVCSGRFITVRICNNMGWLMISIANHWRYLRYLINTFLSN